MNTSLMLNGQAVTLNLPKGPYLRVEGLGVRRRRLIELNVDAAPCCRPGYSTVPAADAILRLPSRVAQW